MPELVNWIMSLLVKKPLLISQNLLYPSSERCSRQNQSKNILQGRPVISAVCIIHSSFRDPIMYSPHFKQKNKPRHHFQQFKWITRWILTDDETRNHFYRNCPILSRSTTLKKHDCNVNQSKTRQGKWQELQHKNSRADYSHIFNIHAESLPEWSGGFLSWKSKSQRDLATF